MKPPPKPYNTAVMRHLADALTHNLMYGTDCCYSQWELDRMVAASYLNALADDIDRLRNREQK